MLTSAQQDYLEIIFRLEISSGSSEVTISEIAAELGTKLPTVTRTIAKLTDLGIVNHKPRRGVALSTAGRKIASEVVHRHEDLVEFFVTILGLRQEEAEIDSCQIEHGISGKTAQRLHEFLKYFNSLSKREQRVILEFQRRASRGNSSFRNLPPNKANGWRT